MWNGTTAKRGFWSIGTCHNGEFSVAIRSWEELENWCFKTLEKFCEKSSDDVCLAFGLMWKEEIQLSLGWSGHYSGGCKWLWKDLAYQRIQHVINVSNIYDCHRNWTVFDLLLGHYSSIISQF